MTASLGQRFVIALFNARNRVRFAMDDAFRPLGVTDATWRTLFYLNQTGNGVSQKELANVMGIEGPSLVRLLDALEDKQLIERRTNLLDRRGKTVHLTARGNEMIVELQAVAARVREDVLRDIDPANVEVCLEVLERILAKVGVSANE